MPASAIKLLLAGFLCVPIGITMFVVGLKHPTEFSYGIWAGPLLSLTGIAACVVMIRWFGPGDSGT